MTPDDLPETPTIPEPAEPPVADHPVQPWTVGTWNKLPNYECTSCLFSTLDLPVMEEHQEKRHATNPGPDQPEARSRRRYMRRE